MGYFRAASLMVLIGMMMGGCLPLTTPPPSQLSPTLDPTRELVTLPPTWSTDHIPQTETPIAFPTLRASSTPLPTSPSQTGFSFTGPTRTPFSTPDSKIKNASYTAVPTPMPLLSGQEHLNILLLGSDKRVRNDFRTDSIIIVSIRKFDGLVTLISVPRDLVVYVPGWRMERINATYFHGEYSEYPGGGAEMMKAMMLYNFGLEIDHVALVDLSGFREIIDVMGGVDVPVACRYTEYKKLPRHQWEEGSQNEALKTIPAGITHMDGDTALWYVQGRKSSNDFDRHRRQQEMLKAIFDKGISLDIIREIPSLYEQYIHLVETDMRIRDIIGLVPLASSLDEIQIRSMFMNRNNAVNPWLSPGGGALMLPDTLEFKTFIERAMAPLPETAGENKTLVEIWNWSSKPDLDLLAANRLYSLRFRTISSLPALESAEETTLIELIPDAAMTEKLLNDLGLERSQLRQEHYDPIPVIIGQNTPAYRLILGDDFNPCFDR